jgi:hypothetical protein
VSGEHAAWGSCRGEYLSTAVTRLFGAEEDVEILNGQWSEISANGKTYREAA